MKITTQIMLIMGVGILAFIIFVSGSSYLEREIWKSQPMAEPWGDCIDRHECLAPYESGGQNKDEKIYTGGVDITAEYTNASVDSGRACDARDRYSTYGKYLCVEKTTVTNTPAHLSRGADREAITHTYTFIYNSKEIPELKENHAYSATFLLPLGYCHDEGMITSVVDLGVSCNGGSTCHGFVIGWGNETQNEVCEG